MRELEFERIIRLNDRLERMSRRQRRAAWLCLCLCLVGLSVLVMAL